MQELQSKLRAELQAAPSSQIIEEQEWTFSAFEIKVSFQKETTTKMDILMKMMLITLQELPIETIEEFTELLGVEALFITDLLNKMERDGLVQKQKNWLITEQGKRQLQTGMYTHSSKKSEETLLFSPLHDDFLQNRNLSKDKDAGETFRYENFSEEWNATKISKEAVEKALNSILEQHNTAQCIQVVTSIDKVKLSHRVFVPCVEYHVQDQGQFSIIARIWNTATEQWDKVLEQLVEKEEADTWQKAH